MNIHENARLPLARRIEMVQQVTGLHVPIASIGRKRGITEATVRTWLDPFLAEGEDGLKERDLRAPIIYGRPAEVERYPPRSRPSEHVARLSASARLNARDPMLSNAPHSDSTQRRSQL